MPRVHCSCPRQVPGLLLVVQTLTHLPIATYRSIVVEFMSLANANQSIEGGVTMIVYRRSRLLTSFSKDISQCIFLLENQLHHS